MSHTEPGQSNQPNLYPIIYVPIPNLREPPINRSMFLRQSTEIIESTEDCGYYL